MKRYDEIMDHIKVTGDMRSRILENIEAGDIAAERRRKQTGRTVTKLLSMAACLAVIIAAASALRSPAQVSTSDDLQTNEGDTPGFVQGGADIVEPDSAAALSAAVGFEVNDIDLPFTPEQTEYISYWHELAEIDYTGEGKTACYRKAAGTEDCSGDYNVYTDVTEFEAGSITVTLKWGRRAVYSRYLDGRKLFLFSQPVRRSEPQRLAGSDELHTELDFRFI